LVKLEAVAAMLQNHAERIAAAAVAACQLHQMQNQVMSQAFDVGT